MKIISEISKRDHRFIKHLEAVYRNAAPNLYDAERMIISAALYGVPFTCMSLKECLQNIDNALAATPDWWLDSYERGRLAEHQFWSKDDIAKDRFGYLNYVLPQLDTRLKR